MTSTLYKVFCLDHEGNIINLEEFYTFVEVEKLLKKHEFFCYHIYPYQISCQVLMNWFGILFLVVLSVLCIVEVISLVKTIVVKRKEKQSLKQAQDSFQSLVVEDNSNKGVNEE